MTARRRYWRTESRTYSPAFVFVVIALTAASAFAGFTVTGDVEPSDPTTWGSLSSTETTYVGNSSNGTLIVSGGSELDSNSECIFGNDSGVSGSVTIDGSGTYWYPAGLVLEGIDLPDLEIGNLGTGTLTVSNGAAVSGVGIFQMGVGTGSSGTLNITGTGSNFDCLGTQGPPIYRNADVDVGVGNGAINILDGGSFTDEDEFDGGDVEIGDSASGSAGSLTISGAGSTFNAVNGAYVVVGSSCPGTVQVTSGGTLTNTLGSLVIGSGSSGVVTVDGVASSCSCGTIDVSSNGTLSISNGANVNTDAIFVGLSAQGYEGSVAVHFGTGGGTLTTSSLYADLSQFAGTGIINTNGLVTDGDLVFDSSQGTNQTFQWIASGENIVVNLNQNAQGDLGVGLVAGSVGSLTIKDGLNVQSADGAVAADRGTYDTAIVEGPGSTWTCTNLLAVGGAGTGTLTISGGATVTAGYVDVGSSNGTLSIIGAGSSLVVLGIPGIDIGIEVGTGEAAIYVSDGGKLTDQGSGGLSIGSNLGVGAVDVDGAGSTCTITDGLLSVANSGTGYLNITNGGTVTDTVAIISPGGSSVGSVLVEGPNSTWNNTSNLVVSEGGPGSLAIEKGAAVFDASMVIGYQELGNVTVDGPGSVSQSSGQIIIGEAGGVGTLAISNGGSVQGASLAINAGSILSMNVGDGSALNLGSGQITEDGTVRLKAAADATAGGVYSPIAAGSWSGTGTVQAIGGTWNASNETFTVSSFASGTAGSPVTVDQSKQQRMLITDLVSGNEVYANFLSTTASTDLTFTATVMASSEVSSLEQMLSSNDTFLRGWDFTTSGYTTGNPVYLSMSIGPGADLDYLQVWHYESSSGWSLYSADDLTYEGNFASFTVTGFSGYAVVAIPEPMSLWMMLASITILGARRRG